MGFYRLCRPNVQLYRETKVCQSSSGVPRTSVNDFAGNRQLKWRFRI